MGCTSDAECLAEDKNTSQWRCLLSKAGDAVPCVLGSCCPNLNLIHLLRESRMFVRTEERCLKLMRYLAVDTSFSVSPFLFGGILKG